jgi:hypothetical protein
LSRVSISADDGEVVPWLIAFVGLSLAKVVLKYGEAENHSGQNGHSSATFSGVRN